MNMTAGTNAYLVVGGVVLMLVFVAVALALLNKGPIVHEEKNSQAYLVYFAGK